MYRFHRQLVTGTYSINHPVCTRRKKCLCAQIQNIYLHIKYIWIPKNHSHPLSLTAKEDNEGYKLQYNVLFYKKNRDAQLPFCSIDQSVSRVAIYNPPFLPSIELLQTTQVFRIVLQEHLRATRLLCGRRFETSQKVVFLYSKRITLLSLSNKNLNEINRTFVAAYSAVT